MSGSEVALEAAVLARLQATAEVRAVLGDPIRGLNSAEGLPPYPYLEVVGHQVRAIGGTDAPAFEHRLDLAIVARADARGGTQQAMAAVRGALEGAALQPSGWRCVLAVVERAEALASRRAREVRGLIRLRVVLEPA